MTNHNFQNFTQELVECEDGGAPHINGKLKDGHEEKLERHGGMESLMSKSRHISQGGRLDE